MTGLGLSLGALAVASVALRLGLPAWRRRRNRREATLRTVLPFLEGPRRRP